jgi:hypothetical protein
MRHELWIRWPTRIGVTSLKCTYGDSERKGDITTTVLFWLSVDGVIDLLVSIIAMLKEP